MKALITALGLSIVAASCTWDADQDPFASTLHAPAPYPVVEDDVPLGNVPPGPDHSLGVSAGGHALKAPINPLGRGKATGVVDFHEVGDGVRVSVALDGADPGPARVSVEDSDCHKLPAGRPPSRGERRAATGGVLEGPREGNMNVQLNGQAAFTTSIPDANLQPNQAGTLLGKAVVVYRAAPVAYTLRTSEMPIACAMVRRRK